MFACLVEHPNYQELIRTSFHASMDDALSALRYTPGKVAIEEIGFGITWSREI